jgi:Holliday junction resolvase
MSAMQRRKGRAAEQELARLLREHLGADIARNLQQSAVGGHDLIGVAGFALEAKRCERLALGSWWRQACDQAARAGLIPALAYRQSRQPWRFVVPLAILLGEPIDIKAIATLGLPEFVTVVRRLAAEHDQKVEEGATIALMDDKCPLLPGRANTPGKTANSAP